MAVPSIRPDFPIRRVAVAVAALASVILGGTAGYWILGEGRFGVSDCLYMTITTAATVGFREVIPVGDDPALRAWTVVVILGGGGSVLYLWSILTAFLVEGDLNQIIRRRRMEKEIRSMRDHYVVCGIGRNGEHAADRLVARGLQVVLVDRTESILRAFSEAHGRRVPYVVGDATDEEVLLRAGLDHARGLIASLEKDQDNLYLILSARQVNPKVRIVSKINEKRARQKFVQVGADAVVSPTAIGGLRMFSEMVHPGVVSFLDDVLHQAGEDLWIDEVPIPPGSPLHGRRLDESDIRKRTNLLVAGVRDREGGRFTYNPGPEFELESGMTLIVLGPGASIDLLRQMVGS